MMYSPLHRLYYEDYLLTSIRTAVTHIGSDELGSYVITRETIFHPKGGGQPKDEGTIAIMDKKYTVSNLGTNEKGEVKHYLQEKLLATPEEIGTVTMEIDKEKRILHARYHTAAHLIDEALAPVYPTLVPYKGNHIPGQAAVFYILKNKQRASLCKEDFDSYDPDQIMGYLTQRLTILIREKIPIHISYQNGLRIVRIGNFRPSHCGGTHIKHTGILGSIIIKKIKYKKKEGFKIAYEMQ